MKLKAKSLSKKNPPAIKKKDVHESITKILNRFYVLNLCMQPFTYKLWRMSYTITGMVDRWSERQITFVLRNTL